MRVLWGCASLVLPGAGQLAQNRPWRALLLVALAAVLWWAFLAGHLVHLWAATDAALAPTTARDRAAH